MMSQPIHLFPLGHWAAVHRTARTVFVVTNLVLVHLGQTELQVSWALPPQAAISPEFQAHPPRMAQLFYPPAEPAPVVRVIGKGQASQMADLAELSFEFDPLSQESSPAEPTALAPGLRLTAAPGAVTEVDLKAVLQALLAAGISQNDIRTSVDSTSDSSSIPFPLPFPPKSSGSGAHIIVQQKIPTQAKLSQIVDTVERAAGTLKSVTLSRVGVSYKLQDCQALEASVYQAAVRSARHRAQAIATAMGATLNPIPSVAQPFYELIVPSCQSSTTFPFGKSNSNYDPKAMPEVSLTRDIFVTYTLKP